MAAKRGRPPAPTTKKARSTTDEAKIFCLRCGCSDQSNFYQTKDKNRKFFGKIPYCKDCIKEFYSYYLKKYGDNNLAIYYTCRKIDIPYVHRAYLGALENVNKESSRIKGEENLLQAYIKNMSFAEQNGWGAVFDDSSGEDAIGGLTSYDVYTKVKKDKRVVGGGNSNDDDRYETIEYDTEFLQSKWGIYDNEELASLESEYLDWAEKLGFKNGIISEKSIDVIVKQICYQTLEINNDRVNGNDVNKKVDTLTKLMSNAGLIEKQKSNSEVERGIGQRIEDIERFRPVKEVDSDLADVDNIKMLFDAFVGCMARSLNKSNAYTKAFEEEYAKYSIDLIENSDTEGGEPSDGK